MEGKTEEFFQKTLDMFKIAYKSTQVARCYRNLGFYFVEKKLFQEAVICYLLSLSFEKESKQATSELYYIDQVCEGKVNKNPTEEEIKKCAEQYGFPRYGDEDILVLAFSYGKAFSDKGDMDAFRYFMTIAYDLTGDEDIGEMLDKLPAKEA